jgi:ribosomal protein S18 acetylase RimI-like enzyme
MSFVEPVEQNLRCALRTLASATGVGECRELPGLLIAAAGLDFAVFNAALLTPPAAATVNEFERRLLSAVVRYQARGLPWSFWLSEDLVQREVRREAERIITRCGLAALNVCPGMIADRIAPPGASVPDMEFRPVTDPDVRTSFCHVMGTAFMPPFGIARAIYGAEHVWRAGFQGWVGYAHGDAVTTAAVLPSGDVLGVYAVATLPAWQRRGYAEAVTRHALAEARRTTGIECSVLQSTRAGLALYRKMGYRQTTSIAVYQSC